MHYNALIQIGNAQRELGVLHELCIRSEKLLAGELEVLHGEMDKQEERLTENELEALLSDINDHYIMVAEELPLFQNYSNFLLGYSIFEKYLNDVCTHIFHERPFSLPLKDVYGQGISRAKLYLSKVAGFPKLFSDNDWSAVVLYGEVRNALAHRSGFIDYSPENPGSFFVKLQSFPGIELEHETQDQADRRIKFGTSFVIASIKAYETFFTSLWKEIEDSNSR